MTGLQKAVCDDPEAVPARDVLDMAVKNGAYAMGLDDCDTVAVGKRADLIMIEQSSAALYSASKQNVKMTMVNGKVFIQGRKIRD